MVKAELIKRSPLRLLEKSLHGGIKAGEMGVICSGRGIGKTACLVHTATDQLFQEKHVIHVSFAARTEHIVNWYEDIFKEIAKKRDLDSALEIHDDLIKNRVILNFSQGGVKADQVIKTLQALIGEGNFDANVIIVDGYDFADGEPDFIAKLKEFAGEKGLSVWASADVAKVESTLPPELAAYVDSLDVAIGLTAQENHMKLNLLKDRSEQVDANLHLELDPKTLLIVEEK